MALQLVYPDVLGAVTGGVRVSKGPLQYAAGIFPTHIFLNQPLEIVIILQSMINQELPVRIAIKLPRLDQERHPLVFHCEQTRFAVTLAPGEVGLLHVPLVALPPTQPRRHYPIRITVRAHPPPLGGSVRPPAGGPPPSALMLSPFRLRALQDVAFTDRHYRDSDQLVLHFDLAQQALPRVPVTLRPSYERLWTAQNMRQEEHLVQSQIEAARRIAIGAEYGTAYWALLDATIDRFAEAGMPLHPGEARAIAKMLAYTVDEAPTLEATIADLEAMSWFRTLCQVLAARESWLEEMNRGELLARHVYDAILYDAILMGFKVCQPRVHENLGDLNEQVAYANQVVSWLAGSGGPDLNYIYLPLAMGGVIVNQLVQIDKRILDKRESPWLVVDGLSEAYRGRIRLATDDNIIVFELLVDLLEEAASQLSRQRIPRD